MEINKKLIPLKVHYFFFLGCMSPILPFLIVVAAQLGIPVSVQGILSATTLFLTVFAKPVIAAIADTFPSYRKAIFLVILTFMVGCYCSLWFIPPMKASPVLNGQLVRARVKLDLEAPPSASAISDDGLETSGSLFASQPLLLTHSAGSCYIAVAWDCLASCKEPRKCTDVNINRKSDIKAEKIDGDQVFQVATDLSDVFLPDEEFAAKETEEKSLMRNTTSEEMSPYAIASGHLYQLEGVNISWDLIGQNISLQCIRGDWSGGDRCEAVWHYWEFWVYVLLLLVGQISFNTGNSITDAIAVDSTSDSQRSYGYQRAWGTIGWGLMGPVSGLLVDLWSGSSITKDYTPAFLLVFILGSIDFFTCASSLKVPQIGNAKTSVLKDVGPLLRQPRFFMFCCFVIANGMFDGIVACFIFLMQEEMAQGTSAMRYMKLLQGFTLFVQCFFEAPFMFVYGWFMQRLGAQRVTSLVFFLYVFRLLGLSLVGFHGPVWATLLTETLNGPCYGLGYTAIVVYSAKISPPGTSTTVQSVVNICYESFGYALAAFFGGLLFESVGGPRMYMIAGIASAVTFILHLLSLRFFPPPEERTHVVADPHKATVRARRGGGGEAKEEEELALNENEDPDRSHRGSIESSAREEVEETTPMEHK